MADGAIPAKYKELIARRRVHNAMPYCIEIHAAKLGGRGNRFGDREVVTIAAALRAGAAITHGTMRSRSVTERSYRTESHD